MMTRRKQKNVLSKLLKKIQITQKWYLKTNMFSKVENLKLITTF